ncbi:MAG: diguanylate cyclase [Candidatus Aureabacteria bacterium]|nr:diguanylate cyclase [Candidatus Auribacterota bacterium]
MPKRLFKRTRRAEKRQTGVATLCGIAVTAGVSILYALTITQPLELSVSDWLVRRAGTTPAPPEIVLIELGQETIETIQKWPIPRDIYARLLAILTQAGAHSVGFNILFTERSNPEADQELAKAIRQAGMVYLPYYFESIPATMTYRRPVDNLPLFKEAAKSEGHINMFADVDGVMRWVQLMIPYEGGQFRQLAFLIACDWLGVDMNTLTLNPGKSVELRTRRGEKISIPLDERGAMFIGWNGPWRKVFRHYTLADIFESADQARAGGRPRIPLSELKGCICLVGLTAPGTFDAMRTPFDYLEPSVGIHASIISQILQQRFVTVQSKSINLMLIILIGLGVSLAFPHLKPVAGIAAMLGACAFYTAAALYFFFARHTIVALINPLGTMVFAYVTISIHHEIVISVERARLHYLATRDSLTTLYIIGHFRLLLNAEIAEAQREGRAVSLIMADIDLFKKFNDTYGHQEGDYILKEVARIMNAACRDLDLVGRYGGEEFIVMLSDAGLKEAQSIAERIRKTVEAHVFSHEGRKHRVTLSLGVSQLDQLDAAEDFIKRADEALYDAKHKGRNRVCVKEPAKGGKKVIILG